MNARLHDFHPMAIRCVYARYIRARLTMQRHPRDSEIYRAAAVRAMDADEMLRSIRADVAHDGRAS